MGPSGEKLVGLLATPARLRIVAAIVLGAATPSEVVSATGLEESAMTSALTKLLRGGLVTLGTDGALIVDVDVFAQAARTAASKVEPVDYGVSDPKVAAVLHAFLVDGRLTTIPAPGRKRRIVLEYLVTAFEPGRRYSEPEVNAVLGAFHPDTAALRRYLVVDGLLSREPAGVYWRSGGWVDVL